MHSLTSRVRRPVIGVSNNNSRADGSIDSTPAAVGKSAFRAGAAAARLRRGSGFTLIELMITLTVAVILIIIAVPSFKTIILSNKLTTTSNNLVNAIAVARLEAIKRNTTSQLCSNSSSINTTNNVSATLGSSCTSQTGAVYVLTTSSSATKIADGIVGLTSPIQLSGNMTALTFGSSGLAYQVGSSTLYDGPVADICTSSISTNNHRKVVMAAGSIITTSSSTATCP